ncbi:MAG: hypothetical protein DIU70_006035 [Bacillota bacterium]
MERILAVVTPLVWTLDYYRDAYGVEDPEELALIQWEDVERARRMEIALRDLYGLEADLTRPRDREGPEEEIGTPAELRELRELAAAAAGFTLADYHEGRVPPGYLYQHLINHDEADGYYLPLDFPQPFWLGDEEEGDEVLSVGSAVALRRELEALRPVLAERFPREMAAAERGSLPPAGPVRVWAALLRLTGASLEQDLPIQLG